jgi:hypothetical protein
MKKLFVTEPVQAGNFTNVMPEFGRVADVIRHFGLKRGTLYNLYRDGKIRGVLLRVRGRKSGVRLFDLASVREFIRSHLDAETTTPTKSPRSAGRRTRG